MPELEWDEAKRISNMSKHGIDFALAAEFYWDVARIQPDRRGDYGEDRLSATAPLLGRLHVLVYTLRNRKVRIISLRKANKRERRVYEEAMADRTDQ
ncbi:BrnT family toxin [Fulvimarina sp. 2208YS6-2-32]|uniref:BrnT family toxin n=1 Tax=Fulvimarina uroteuthidis TaxID=3098149 RepID=A0ABU5I098_9HYPH|nr:BrnT family toxin [Fulvimarina sp. 2208YS6-2-32]MDY8108814.1 BrnT family toxin [Fulvimarina sp. 2208YS6-2-32]